MLFDFKLRSLLFSHSALLIRKRSLGKLSLCKRT